MFHSDSDKCLVAEIDGRIVGFALGTVISKKRSAWKYGHLIWLGIDPEFHRQGVAARLFKHFKNIMMGNGVRMLLIDTEAGNHPAIGFFKKMGFGNPQGHIYFSLNLSDLQRHGRGRSNNRTGCQAV